jgi:hypothetical protein
MLISRSGKLAPGVYRFPERGGDSALITIRGHDIEADPTGVVLQGLGQGTEPDQAVGLAILIDGGQSITNRWWTTSRCRRDTTPSRCGTARSTGEWSSAWRSFAAV